MLLHSGDNLCGFPQTGCSEPRNLTGFVRDGRNFVA
jgi:hypothetical protein